MGAYINPIKGTKEQFLIEKASIITEEEFKSFDYSDKTRMPVCLVQNDFFSAAGVAYSIEENQSFTHENDIRPKQYFIAKVSDLLEVSDIKMYNY